MTRVAAVVLIAVIGVWPAEAAPDTRTVAQAIERRVAGNPELLSLYGPSAFVPLWVDEAGTPVRPAAEALRLLASAADDGLDPAEYAVAWRPVGPGVSVAAPEAAETTANFDVALSDALLRYLRHLHLGRVDPRRIGFTLNVPQDGHDFPALVREAAGRGSLVELAQAWAPRGPQYPALVVALRHYRELAEHETPPRLLFPRPVHPGEQTSQLSALHERLVLLGDVAPGESPPAGEVYGGATVLVVRHFQQRHGLDPDGVLGARTVAELQVPLSVRVRQLELAMERLRWLPHAAASRLLLVNIPMFRLLAWDTIPPSGVPSFTTGTIVGRALNTQTPVFDATLSEIVFRPYWNVPTSIVRKEVWPRLAKDPGYLAREQMELVAGQGDLSPVVEPTPENLARLRTGVVRLRQRPGPKNALGLIKFSFPNEHDVYMHGTPVQSLFAKSRRDFSHGCVRVEDPVGLAAWLLASQEGWSRDRVDAAMQASVSSRVTLRTAVRVMLLYSTASVQLDSGEVLFAEDIYQHDARLDRALRERPASAASPR